MGASGSKSGVKQATVLDAVNAVNTAMNTAAQQAAAEEMGTEFGENVAGHLGWNEDLMKHLGENFANSAFEASEAPKAPGGAAARESRAAGAQSPQVLPRYIMVASNGGWWDDHLGTFTLNG